MNNFYENWRKERPILGLTAGVGGGGVGNFNQGGVGVSPSNAPFVCTGGTINTAPVDGVQYKFHKFFKGFYDFVISMYERGICSYFSSCQEVK